MDSLPSEPSAPPPLPPRQSMPVAPLSYATPREEPPVKTFFHQAARASWLAPGIALLLGMCLNSSMRSDPHAQGTRVILAIVNMLLVATGFVLGIVALFGIKRYGARGILSDAIFGLLLSGGILVLMVWVFVVKPF